MARAAEQDERRQHGDAERALRRADQRERPPCQGGGEHQGEGDLRADSRARREQRKRLSYQKHRWRVCAEWLGNRVSRQIAGGVIRIQAVAERLRRVVHDTPKVAHYPIGGTELHAAERAQSACPIQRNRESHGHQKGGADPPEPRSAELGEPSRRRHARPALRRSQRRVRRDNAGSRRSLGHHHRRWFPEPDPRAATREQVGQPGPGLR